jgi:sialidase-1
MCLDAGINRNIQCWSPVIMPHKDYSVITYRDSRTNETRKIKLQVGSRGYERAWSQFAQSFEAHQRQLGWLDLTTVGLDELSTEVLDKIVPVFRKIAPDLQLMVSGGDEEGKYTQFTPETAFHYGYIQSEVPLPDRKKRRSEGKRTLFYTAFSPLYPNTFIFSEPLEARMLPWLVWKHDFDGYIRWAWNFWLEDFREQPRYKWHSGDMFLIYPGEEGPMDSIRTEMFLKGARDYECLWMIREHLERLRRQGDDRDRVSLVETQLAEALELAVQQMDPVRPYRPLNSDFGEARRRLHEILLALK